MSGCRAIPQTSPYAGRSEGAGADCRGPGQIFSALLAGRFSQALLDARGAVPEPPEGPSKTAKDSPVRPSLCSAAQLQRPSALRPRCGPAEFRGAAAEGWIRRVKGLRRWCAVIGPRAACPPRLMCHGEERTRPWPFLLGQRYSVWPGAWQRRLVPRLTIGLGHRETNHSRLS